MENFREAAAEWRTGPAMVYLETEAVPLALFQRLQKYFPFKQALSLNPEIAAVRAIKSAYELGLMEKAGEIHRRVMEEEVPKLLREGMSEAELGAEVFRVMISLGHHGVSRFAAFDTELLVGHVSFGESSLHPTSFNGAGGNYGLNAATPLLGSRERKLKHGDLVYMDICCGVEGYHTDKTLTYMFGGPAPADAAQMQARCEELQNQIASMLKPGAAPSKIYHAILQSLGPEFQQNFMGFGNRRVKFLGHGIGLVVDETPVLADGFDEPIVEGMVFAVEPKKGIPNFGMVGIENTFVVTTEGGRSITGASAGLMAVG
jgi:Xaa-Pro aminopeptidase